MRLEVLDKKEIKQHDGSMGYYVKVSSNYGDKVVKISKKRYFRAEVGNKVDVTVSELQKATEEF